MTLNEFWTIYDNKYLKHENGKFRVCDHPLGSDNGILEMAIFTDENGTWCYERTQERRNTPLRKEFATEEEAVDYLYSQLKYYVNIL